MKLQPLVACVLALAVLAGFSGCNRGPARTDAQVAAEVQGKIVRDSKIDSREIGVQAEQGVVTLTGAVSDDQERTMAAADAATVDGVKTVINNMVVQPAQVAAASSPESPPVPQSKVRPARTASPGDTGESSAYVGGLPKANGEPSSAPENAQPADPGAVQPAPPTQPKKFVIPAGTQLTVRLNDGLDTERNQIGDQFHASLSAPIMVDDETVIPSGADIIGRVVDVKSSGRFAGNSVLTLELTSLSIHGRTYNLQTNQWSRKGKGEGKNTAVKAGGGAALGAIIGGLAGGGKGAAIGSVAGAGAGTGVAATKKGEQIKLAPEASLSFLLVNTVTVIQQPSNNRNAGRAPLQ
jgi:BON domain